MPIPIQALFGQLLHDSLLCTCAVVFLQRVIFLLCTCDIFAIHMHPGREPACAR